MVFVVVRNLDCLEVGALGARYSVVQSVVFNLR
jgi:hypothetical protein